MLWRAGFGGSREGDGPTRSTRHEELAGSLPLLSQVFDYSTAPRVGRECLHLLPSDARSPRKESPAFRPGESAGRNWLAVRFALMNEPQHVFGKAVNVRPAAIANAIAVAGNVDHVGMLGNRVRHTVVGLLVCDDDKPIMWM